MVIGTNEALRSRLYESLEEKYFGYQPNEAEILAMLQPLLQNVKVFVDVGASLGLYTYHANRNMRDGTILALEADPVRFERLKENCARWAAESSNRIIPINVAIADEDGEIEISVSDSEVSGGIAVDSSRSKTWRKIRVPMRKLDTIFAEYSGRAFIKMDIEGAEYLAFQGARNLLASGPDMILEVHSWGDPKFNKQSWDVLRLLADEGYGARCIHKRFLLSKDCPFGASSEELQRNIRYLRLRGFLRPVRRILNRITH